MPDPNSQNFNPLAEGADESGAPLDLAAAAPAADDAAPVDPVAALEAARNEATQTRDQLLRAMADAENMRRRTQTDIANAHKFAIENFATSLLPVRDTLEMALVDKTSSVDQIKMGVDLTLKNLAAAFDKAKIVEISPQGQKFDPNRHQALIANAPAWTGCAWHTLTASGVEWKIAMCVVISLERFQVPPSCLPLPSTMHIMSGVMKPLLTPVGVQMKRSGPSRAEMLPPLPSQYSRAQMRRPMSQICSLIEVASFEAKSATSSLL